VTNDETDPPIVGALLRLSGRDRGYGPRKALTRERLVQVATEHFVEHGYRRASMEAIADAASMSRATLYTYVTGKEQMLLMAVADEALANLDKVRAAYDPSLSAEARLRFIVREAVVYILAMPLSARLARDRDPEVLAVLLEHGLVDDARRDQPELDKGLYYASLIEAVSGGTLHGEQAQKLASLIRAISFLAPGLADSTGRFGLSIEEVGEMLSRSLVDGWITRRGQ
jgi:AcrR family transcriptional regulator